MGDEVVHKARGALLVVVLGPVIVIAALVALLTVLNMFLSGLDPSTWFSDNSADWLFGQGGEGSAASYVRMMVCAAIVAAGVTAIRWGFYGTESDR